MSDDGRRIERDSMGELEVPEDALWGAQTQRAVNNFPISGLAMPRAFIRALGLIKWAAAGANSELGLMNSGTAIAIQSAAMQVASGEQDAHFPIDVFQTGSGTSSNMNANEVIAHLATDRLGTAVHPNDDVNMGQSSNDVIPTAVHVSAALLIVEELLPSLQHLKDTLEAKADETRAVIKTGRTHLMDAMPVSLAQELGVCPDVFLQINTGEEPQKAGVLPVNADRFVADCLALDLPVHGLMCIPPADEDPAPHFSMLADIAARNGLSGLSMGMSSDFEQAIALGATHIRVGAAIFGERRTNPV